MLMMRHHPVAAPPRARWTGWALAAIMVIAALAARWPRLADPLAGLDEQFYLLVGDRLLGGALPYVDIWDRKPIGLFLLYAGARLLPGDGVLAYQLLGTLCLAVTGAVAALIARRAASWTASIAAGLLVIAYATLIGEGLGEAPIFYDLFVAGAFWLTLRVSDAPHAPAATRQGAAAMLLAGLAITIKTIAIFEAAALGLLLITLHWRAGERGLRWTARAISYAAAAVAPTAAAALVYAALGQFRAWWFANIASILLRSGGASEGSGVQLLCTALILTPLIAPAIFSRHRSPRKGGPPDDRPILLAWTAATAAGLLAIGFFFFHYAVPLTVPLAILATRGLSRAASRFALGLSVAAVAALALSPSPASRDRADLAALLRLFPPAVRTHCLLVREGPAILYHLGHACLASLYAFPGHWSAPGEAHALGRPRGRILADALARRPAAIVDRADAPRPAPEYVRRGAVSVRLYAGTRVPLAVWVRRGMVSQIATVAP